MNLKLIEVLVQELPNRGGWPDGVIKISQDYDGEVWCWFGHDYGNVKSFGRINVLADNHRKQSKDEDSSCFVTREQYEDALAASKPEWDSKELPPVGCRAEVKADDFEGGWLVIDVAYVHNGEVIGIIRSENEYLNDRLEKFSAGYNRAEFRPIRSEADKKKEDAIKAIDDAQSQVFDQDSTFSEYLYDAIAAGKIPHIRID